MEKEKKEETKNDPCCSDEGKKCCCDGFFKKNQNVLILGLVVVVLILASIFINPTRKDSSNVISLEDAKEKAEVFIDENFSDPMFPISIVSIEEEENSSLYRLKIDVGQGELIDSYISNDGKLFFPQGFELDELKTALNDEPVESVSSSAISEPISLDEDFFSSDSKVVVYFFGTDSCPFCRDQKEGMLEWRDKFSSEELEIKEFDTEAEGVRDVLVQLAEKYGTSFQGVPMTFIGDEYWVGYADHLGAEMLERIESCLDSRCEVSGERLR